MNAVVKLLVLLQVTNFFASQQPQICQSGTGQDSRGSVYYWRTYSDGFCRFYKEKEYKSELYRMRKVGEEIVELQYPEELPIQINRTCSNIKQYIQDERQKQNLQRDRQRDKQQTSEALEVISNFGITLQERQLIDVLTFVYSGSW